MAVINVATKEIHAKVVYYGPGFSGKTTNLEYIYRRVPKESKGEMLSLATETERTLFFDFLHLDVAQVRGFTVRFHLYTTPGQQLYERTRFAVLNGTDGVVFVADSASDRQEANAESFAELGRTLSAAGHDPSRFPLVLQANKRDLPNSVPLADLQRTLGATQLSPVPSIAATGDGVFEALQAACRLVAASL